MSLSDRERAYLQRARVARLATADGRSRPQVVPVCFALVGEHVVTAVDEKPADADEELRRVRDVESNPFVSLVVDHYLEDWDRLGWVQIRGRATVVEPGVDGHRSAIEALRGKYEQYETHALEERPLIRIDPGHAISWGELSP